MTPYFPELSGVKTLKTLTKHFTNLLLYLPIEKTAFLGWLVYQSKADNTFIYSTHLLTKYSEAIKSARLQYQSKTPLKTDLKAIRATFRQLVDSGYIFYVEGKMYMLNPMLSYRYEYMRAKEYKVFVARYQGEKDFRSFCKDYMGVVAEGMRKKNL